MAYGQYILEINGHPHLDEILPINLFHLFGPGHNPMLHEPVQAMLLTEKALTLSIHYIFNGIFDYQTPYVVAKDFFNQLNAPEKDFFTFDNSAHSPIVEEADKFNTIVLDITKKF